MRALALALVLAASPALGDDAPFDPGRTHYLFAPSGMLLHGGEAVISQTELLFSTVAFGFGDHATLRVGTAVPALVLAGMNGFNATLELKLGFSPHELVHLAAGLESIALPTIGGGYAFGAATLGGDAAHLTLGGGFDAITVGEGLGSGPPLLFAGASVRAGRHLGLAAEHWMFPTRPELASITAGALRLMFGPFAVALGAAHFAPLRIPLPWLDISVRVHH
jgi:hypothetical protein